MKSMTLLMFTAMLLLAIAPATTFADRGGGSIRAAGRSAPAPARAEPARAEPARAEPSRAQPSRAEPARNEPSRAEPSRVEPARVEPGRGPEVRRDDHVAEPDRRPVDTRRDWDEHDVEVQHGGGFAHGEHVRGERFHDLGHHVAVFFNNQNYFYDDDGNYYLQQGADYVDVQPPVGAVVPSLPPGVITIPSGAATYYYFDGVFYLQQGNAFAVVNPPPGIVVPELPVGANQVIVNGNVFYQFGGLNYQPSIQNGITVYTVTPM
jgi:hypothetical protein